MAWLIHNMICCGTKIITPIPEVMLKWLFPIYLCWTSAVLLNMLNFSIDLQSELRRFLTTQKALTSFSQSTFAMEKLRSLKRLEIRYFKHDVLIFNPLIGEQIGQSHHIYQYSRRWSILAICDREGNSNESRVTPSQKYKSLASSRAKGRVSFGGGGLT